MKKGHTNDRKISLITLFITIILTFHRKMSQNYKRMSILYIRTHTNKCHQREDSLDTKHRTFMI